MYYGASHLKMCLWSGLVRASGLSDLHQIHFYAPVISSIDHRIVSRITTPSLIAGMTCGRTPGLTRAF